MLNGSIANTSLTASFSVKEPLKGGAFTAVALTEGGVATASSSDVSVGILTAEHELPIEAGDEVTVQIRGTSFWIASEEVKAGDLLAAGGDGLAKKASDGEFILAQALSGGKKEEAVNVQIIKAGFKS